MQEVEHRDRNGRPRLSQSNFRVPSSRSAYGSTPGWVEKATKDFLDDAGDTEPSFGIKQLPYTRPQLRETIKRRIMAGSDGGRPGQWSARKAQLVAQAYRRAGGGYRGKPGRTQRSLKKWTSERWTTSDGKPARRKGRMTRYLPAAAWKRLTPSQRRATIAKKLAGDKTGKQFVANTQRAANASKKTRSKTLGPSVDEVAKNPNAPKVFSDTSSEKDRIVSTEPLEQAFSPNKEKLNEITNTPSYGENSPVKPFVHGNIDIDNRQPIEKQNGNFSLIEPTIIDGSGDELGMFVIVPLITKFGQLVEIANASSYFSKTDEHLGKFKSREDAEKYLEWLKDIEEEISYRDKKKPIISMHPIEKIAESAGDGFESRRMSIKNTIKRITDKYMTEKALGPTLRAVNSVQIYDPDAIDADGDGLVQDATPWMRPSLPSSPIIAGLRSMGKSNIASQRAVKEAQEFMKFVSQYEPELTQMMKGLADKKGSSLYLRGLKNRQKTVESLALKAQRLQNLFDGNLTDSITSMNDPLRYTFESDDVNKYTNDVLSVISALAKMGHKASVTNYWTSGDPYKGINVMVEHPDGFFYEIQFHTPSSYRLKNKLTPLYEKYRNEKNVKKRQEIYDEMLKLSKGVSIPKEIGKFGEPLSRGSSQADFKPVRPGKLIPTPLGLSSRRAGALQKFKPTKPVPLSEISADLSDEFPIVTNAYQFATAQPTKNRLRRILDIISRRNDSSQKDALQITKNILRDAFSDDLERLNDGTLALRRVRPSLESSKNELLNSLKIVFDTRPGAAQNLPTVQGKPYAPFDSIISRDIDWRSIFLPDDQDTKDMFGEISKFIFEAASKKMTDDDSELWAKEYRKYKDSLIPEDTVVFTRDEQELENRLLTDETFISIYATGMSSPDLFFSKGVHDAMHLAAGRGFDRHGEWAATLAEISFILNIPGVPDKIKNEQASKFFVETIDTHFDIDEIQEIIPEFSWKSTVFDMHKVLDAFVEKSTYKGVGGMSSKRAMPLRDATTSDINQIADEYLKSERFLRRTDEAYGNESQIGMRSIRERIPMKEILPSTQNFDTEIDVFSTSGTRREKLKEDLLVWADLNEELEKRLLTMDGWTDDQKERIKKQIVDLSDNLRAMRDDWQSMGRSERSRILRRERIIDGFESHPEIDMTIDDIIKQAELRIHDDGTLSLRLPANPVLRRLIPGERDYHNTEIPNKKAVQSMLDKAKAKGRYRPYNDLIESKFKLNPKGVDEPRYVLFADDDWYPFYELFSDNYIDFLSKQRPGPDAVLNIRANEIAAKILKHYIMPELDKLPRNERAKIGQLSPDNKFFIHGYLQLIADPHSWPDLHKKMESKGFMTTPLIVFHDIFGHFALGNTFDRHGEWGNILSSISFARDKAFWNKLREIPGLEDLTEEDRDLFIRVTLMEVASLWFGRVASGDDTPNEQRRIAGIILNYDGPIDELIDMLDPPNKQSQGGMSSTRRTPLTNVTDGQLVNLGLQSVDGVAIREELFKPSGMSSRRRDMTDSEKERLRPITLAPDEKVKLQPGTTLVYTDEYDRIIRTELIGPQVARVRGIPGIKLYTDPSPDNQDAVDARMRQWEIDFGPISSDQRQAKGRGGQPDRTAREQGRPRTTNEDPIDRILRETEEARSRRGLSSRTNPATSKKYFHGSPVKLDIGEVIRPPSETGETPRSHPDIDPLEFNNANYVYLTSNLDEAAGYASDSGSSTYYVYEVEPLSPEEIETDPEVEMGLSNDLDSVRVQRGVKIVGRKEIRQEGSASGSRGLSSRTDTSAPVTVLKNGNFLKIKYGDFEFDIRNLEPTDNNWANAYERLLSWEGSYYSRAISSALLGLEPPMAHGGKGPKAKLAEAVSTGSSKGLSNYDISDFREAVYHAFVSIQRVRDSQPTVRPLYRGMVVDNDSSIVNSSVGDTFSMPLTSFTYVELGAREFAGGSFNSPESSEGTPILIVLEKGAKAADSPRGTDMFRDGYMDSIDDGDGGLVEVPMESITQGKFKIVGRKKTVLPAGEGWEIRIQQLDTYVPAGSGMSSRTNPPVPGWAKEADISRPINGARSTSLEKLSDEEIRALATREGITKEDLNNLYQDIVDAQELLRQSKNKPLLYAPGLGEEAAKRMLDSIRIEMAPNGIPMFIAEPFEAVIDEVPDKRDWSKVLAPSFEEIQRLADTIRKAVDSDSPILEGLSQESRDRMTEAAFTDESPFEQIFARIIEKLGKSDLGESSTDSSSSWIDIYLESLSNPKKMRATQGSDGYHDFFGHFGVGRGFDRHGEWAAALVTDSLIRDHPAFDFLSPNEREGLRRKFFAEGAGGVARLSQQLDTEYERRFGIPRHFSTQKYDPISKTFTEIVDTRTSEQKRVAKEFLRLDRFISDEFRVPKKEARKKGFLRKKPAEGYRAPRLSMDAILDALGVPPATTRPEARSGARGMASTRSSRNSIPFTEANDKLLLSIAGNEAVIKKERSIRNISGMSSRTDTYAILGGRDFEEILDELELNETEKYAARQALLQIYEDENNSTFATRQKTIDKIKNLLSDNPTTPIDEKTKEAIKSISIKVSSNGIPVIFAQPHPTISSILPNRDWSEIEAPSVEYLASILPQLKYKIKSPKDTSYTNQFRVGRDHRATEEAREKFKKQFEDIVRKIQGRNSDAEYNYNNYEQLGGSWVQQYVSLLLNPASGSAIPDIEHDILGHFGTGRGFDRHGEWANAMAITSFILDSDLLDLTEEERDAMALYWLGEYGFDQIFKQLNQELPGDIDIVEVLGKIKFGEFSYAFDGSARELIALLDAENINREGVRSASTRSIKLTEASPKLLLRAEKEASKDRSEFVLKSTLENLSSRPDRNEIISGMSSRNRLTDEQKQQMLEMLADGMGNSEIMKRLGVTMGVVRQFRIKNNISPTGRSHLTSEEKQQMREMVADGMRDTEIAKILDVTPTTVLNYRKINNIPARSKSRLTKEQGRQIIEMLADRMQDSEIAEKLGVSSEMVKLYRARNNIPATGKSRLTSEEKQQMLEMMTDGMNDSEIAEKFGVSRLLVRGHRINNNISPTGRSHLTSEEKQQMREMVADGMRDTEIAKILDVTPTTVLNYRKINNIPRNSRSRNSDKVIALHKLGKVDTEIARELGISTPTVKRIRLTEGLTRNTYRKWNSASELARARSQNRDMSQTREQIGKNKKSI